MKHFLFLILTLASVCAQVLPVVDPYKFAVPTPCDLSYPFPTNGLVAYYKMDETASDATRADSSGNGYTLAKVAQLSAFSDTPGKINNGMAPGAVDTRYGYCAATNSAFNFATNSFTVAFWIADKWTSGSKPQTSAVQFGQQAANRQWQVFWNDGLAGRISLYVAQAGSFDKVSYTNTGLGNAFFLVVAQYVNNGIAVAGTKKISINNGTFVTGATALATSTLDIPAVSRFSIGSFISDSTYVTADPIDEIGVWNRILTADEISALYRCGNGRQP